MKDETVLAMMSYAAKQEISAGFDGFVKPPKECRAQCERLVTFGLAEQSDEDEEFFRPTEAGFAASAKPMTQQ